MSSILSLRFKALEALRFARTTSVFPAAATSRSIPLPVVARARPDSLSTNAAAIKPSMLLSESKDNIE